MSKRRLCPCGENYCYMKPMGKWSDTCSVCEHFHIGLMGIAVCLGVVAFFVAKFKGIL